MKSKDKRYSTKRDIQTNRKKIVSQRERESEKRP